MKINKKWVLIDAIAAVLFAIILATLTDMPTWANFTSGFLFATILFQLTKDRLFQ